MQSNQTKHLNNCFSLAQNLLLLPSKKKKKKNPPTIIKHKYIIDNIIIQPNVHNNVTSNQEKNIYYKKSHYYIQKFIYPRVDCSTGSVRTQSDRGQREKCTRCAGEK